MSRAGSIVSRPTAKQILDQLILSKRACRDISIKGVTSKICQMPEETLSLLKTFSVPSPIVAKVMEAAGILLGADPETWSWSKAKLMLSDPAGFKVSMLTFNRDNVLGSTIDALEPYLNDPELDLDSVESVSSACYVVMCWVMAIDANYRAKRPSNVPAYLVRANTNN